MIAATSPVFTVRFKPSRIGLPLIEALRFLDFQHDFSCSLFAVEMADSAFDPADGTDAAGKPVHDQLHPTLPSSEIAISFCASTANSIGSCCSTSRTKPLTISAVASSPDSPRCRQ